MNISRKDVRAIFHAVLDGSMSRDAADRWAHSIMKQQEAGTLNYIPVSAGQCIWDAVMFLNGIDLKHCQGGEFLESMESIEDAMRRTVGQEES